MEAIVYKGKRVITTELLAAVYDTTPDRIKQNFNRNKGKFEEETHFFFLQGYHLKEFKDQVSSSDLVSKNTAQLYLWTERGANRHCKILDTDKAWEQFDHLEDTYFRVKSIINGLPNSTVPPSVSPSGLANLIRITRRVMLDMGSTPQDVGQMAKSVFNTWNIQMPECFNKQIPGQFSMWEQEKLWEGTPCIQ